MSLGGGGGGGGGGGQRRPGVVGGRTGVLVRRGLSGRAESVPNRRRNLQHAPGHRSRSQTVTERSQVKVTVPEYRIAGQQVLDSWSSSTVGIRIHC